MRLGDRLRIEQRNNFYECVNKLYHNQPRELLRNIHGDSFNLISEEIPGLIQEEIGKTNRFSCKKALKIAYEWSQGNYICKWWTKIKKG